MAPPIGDVVALNPEYTDFFPYVLEGVPGSSLYEGKKGHPQIIFIPGGVEKISNKDLKGAIRMAGEVVGSGVPEPHQKFDYPGAAGANSHLPVRYDGSPEDLRDLVGGGFVSPRLAAKAVRALQKNSEQFPFYGSWMIAREVPYEEEARNPEGFYEWFLKSPEFLNSQQKRSRAEGDDQFNSGPQEEQEDPTSERQFEIAERYLLHARA